MSSPRRAYDALVRWTVAAYDSGQAPFFLRTTRYEPLAQDSLSIKRPRFRVPPCRTRVFAYLAAALSVVLLFAVYTRGSSLSVGFDASRAAISKEDFIAAVVRDPVEDLGTKDQSAEMSYLLDADYFLKSWKLACPQMRALVSDSEAPGNASSKAELSPNKVKSFQMRKYLIVDPTGWREAFDEWMTKNPIFKTMSTENPVRVWQNLAFAQWNRLAHSPEFGNSFPRLFQHPPQTRRLAASALWGLEKEMGRSAVADTILFSPETPTNQSIVNSLGPDRLASGGFLGAHLRVAADAAAAGWPGYEAQAPVYISEAKARNLTAIYLATGSAENREQFRQDAAREGLDTYVKEDLLDEEELAELRKLTWDQQALVDFEVLMHSAMFYGFVRSSYSWALALRRGTLPEAGTPEWSKDEHEYRDNLSAIVGRYRSINPEGLWP